MYASLLSFKSKKELHFQIEFIYEFSKKEKRII